VQEEISLFPTGMPGEQLWWLISSDATGAPFRTPAPPPYSGGSDTDMTGGGIQAYCEIMSNSGYAVRRFRNDDRVRILEIFNHHVTTTVAALAAEPVPPQFIDGTLQDAQSFLVAGRDGEVAVFGFMRPFLPFSTFQTAASVTDFAAPGHTRSGLGSRILKAFESDAGERGIRTLLAAISSRNIESLKFHRKRGFYECGKLPGIGVKFGEHFDVIRMVKGLSA